MLGFPHNLFPDLFDWRSLHLLGLWPWFLIRAIGGMFFRENSAPEADLQGDHSTTFCKPPLTLLFVTTPSLDFRAMKWKGLDIAASDLAKYT